MDPRHALFLASNPYDVQRTAPHFMSAVRQNVVLHQSGCEGYAAILAAQGFDPACLRGEEDLWRIPPLPTLYFKRNQLITLPEEKLVVRATSSGTRGLQSQIGLDRRTLLEGVAMMVRFFGWHGVLSPLPTNYIVLNMRPDGKNGAGAAKTAYHTTRFAPALHREFALIQGAAGVEVNFGGIRRALLSYARQGFPVRFVGFPAYLYFLVRQLKNAGLALRLPAASRVLLGGGWKQFGAEEIDRDAFYGLIEETLGIPRAHCLEFFSAVEHPLPYCKCLNGHFHVPAYSRVIVRDVRTLAPLPHGQEGLLNFVSPLVRSMPLTSVLTDDLGVLQPGEGCGCGIGAPYFELLGRAGVQQIKTCAATAAELLAGGTT